MTSENELRELRDTLAIEITREMVRKVGSEALAAHKRDLERVYELADAVLTGRGGAPEQWYAPNQCQICGWPLVTADGSGCTPTVCYFIPDDRSPEAARIKKRRAWVEAQPDRPFSVPYDIRRMAGSDIQPHAQSSLAQAAEDETFVRANYPGICRTYSDLFKRPQLSDPNCPPECISIKLGGKELWPGGDIQFEASTIPLPSDQAWAMARYMTEARIKAEASR
jgi:hypothetical protein